MQNQEFLAKFEIITIKALTSLLHIFIAMKALKILENKKIRSSWNDEQEKWYFSIIDVIEVLTDSPRPRKYWNALKNKLQAEGSELSHKIGQLKMQSEGGKYC